ncbi:hypothetical protein OGAPHI_006176 [Ogataea philodendri]|uniref:Uncharacterized protein n=2 Tax=Saccharomycotina TaxID=147537 RepID=A0A9P8NYB0_9ASCO|nr:uncharacterized protein OGAPHI_006176 [Ogataea philodendri]KAH3661995.1 hypothetical protein OGAPHI_006176 [Ogataea philodendri]
MASGFPVDVPVTNLDIDDENFEIDDYDDDNVSLDLQNLRPSPESAFGKLKTKFSNLLKTPRNEFQYLDTIEMFDRNRSESSFADVGDFAPPKKRSRKKLLFHLTLIGFVALLLLISYLLTHKQGHATIKSAVKPLLSNGTHQFYPSTILVSLDGFHPHYISLALTPFLSKLISGKGYGPPYMIPSNPTVTFVNHYTLVTGLKPSYHGIVSNRFYDSATNEAFVNTNNSIALQPQWWGGEPLWSTAARQGVSSAVHMWPGSEVDYSAQLNPMDVDKFNQSEVLSRKVERLMEWIDRPIETRPELMLSYVPTIDSLGHKYGVSGPELSKGLVYVDNFLESLYWNLEQRNLRDLVNVVIVSDHGMAPTSDDRLIYLDDLVELSKIEHTDGWPLFGLRPYAEYDVDSVYEELLQNREADPMKDHYSVHKKQDIETVLFGGKGPYDSRIAPIWVIPDVGYSITTHEDMAKKKHYTPKGVHGYNNTAMLMRSLFVGTGPYFESKLGESYKVVPFENTEVYNIVCESLNLSPNPNNGTLTSFLTLDHALPSDWTDSKTYPDTDFEVELMHSEATVDLLWGKKKSDSTEEQDKPEEQQEEPETKPEAAEQGDSQGADESDDESDDEENEDAKQGHKQGSKDDTKNDSSDDSISDGKDNDDEDEEEDDEDEEKPSGFSFHDLWHSIEETAEEIAEEVEDFIDDTF